MDIGASLSVLGVIGVLSVIAERTVELLKGVIPYDKIGDDKLRAVAIQATSCIIAGLTAYTSAAQFASQLPNYLQGPMGSVLVGLLAGTGSVGAHQALTIFEQYKKIRQEELTQAQHTSALYASDVAERQKATPAE